MASRSKTMRSVYAEMKEFRLSYSKAVFERYSPNPVTPVSTDPIWVTYYRS